MKILWLDITPHLSDDLEGFIPCCVTSWPPEGESALGRDRFSGLLASTLLNLSSVPPPGPSETLKFHLQSGRKGLFQSHGSTRKKSWSYMNDICRPMLNASHGLNELFLGMGTGPRQGRVWQFCLEVQVAPQVLKTWDPQWFIKLSHSSSYL